LGSIVLAGLFTALWWLRPAWRRAVEAPKHGFAARVRQHDRACRDRAQTHE
jgi:hypothetical protein